MPDSPDKDRVLTRLQQLEREERILAESWRRMGRFQEAAGHDGRADAFSTARDIVHGVPF